MNITPKQIAEGVVDTLINVFAFGFVWSLTVSMEAPLQDQWFGIGLSVAAFLAAAKFTSEHKLIDRG